MSFTNQHRQVAFERIKNGRRTVHPPLMVRASKGLPNRESVTIKTTQMQLAALFKSK